MNDKTIEERMDQVDVYHVQQEHRFWRIVHNLWCAHIKKGDDVDGAPWTPEKKKAARLALIFYFISPSKGLAIGAAILSLVTVVLMQRGNTELKSQTSKMEQELSTMKTQLLTDQMSNIIEINRLQENHLKDASSFISLINSASPKESLCSEPFIDSLANRIERWVPLLKGRVINQDSIWMSRATSPARASLFNALNKCNLPDRCKQRIFSKGDFSSADFSGKKIFEGDFFYGLRLDYAYFDRSEWANMNFSALEMRDLFAKDTKFIGCNFFGADFSNSSFENCQFIKCNLSGMNMQRCSFRGTFISNSCITNGLDLSGSEGDSTFLEFKRSM